VVWGTFVRRHVVTLAIAVVAAMLGAYLYFVDSGRVTSSEADARKRNLFKAFRRADITALLIENNGETVRIARRTDDAGDAMYYLGAELADQTAVDKTLSVLEFATAERRLEEGIDRRATGLDAPKLRVTLSMGVLTFRVAIGGPAPAPSGAAYAEVQGEGVSVVSRDLVTELARPLDTYRGKTIVPYLSSALSELWLDASGDTHRFSVGAWGGWAAELEGGQKVRVDRDAFDRVLGSLADVRAEAFTTDAEADRALGAASAKKLRITMIPREKAQPRAVIDLGGECPGHPEDAVAVRNEPAPRKTACVPKGVIDSLVAPLARIVDLHPFSLRPDEMEQITLASGDNKLDLIRAGTGWHMRAPTDASVDNDVGQGFARTLHDLVAEEVVTGKTPEPAPPGAPRATAKISKTGAGDGGAGLETVELGVESGGFVHARRLIDGAILKLNSDAARTLIPTSFALRSRKVIDEPLGHVARVAIEGTSVRQVLRRSSAGGWTFEEPKSLAVDPGLASDVADALAQLRADRWVADRDDGSFGLQAPRGTYQLELEAGIIRVETGRATAGGVFARRTDQEGVFVLPKATERVLETWAIDRSYLMFEPSEIRQIRLDRGGGHRLTLEPARAGGSDAGPSAERFEIARRVLVEARAEGTVHLGEARKDEGLDKPLLTVTIQRASPASPSQVKIAIGRGDAWRETNVFYVRREGVDATFAIAQSKLRPLLDLK